MAWTTPFTAVAGSTLTSAMWNSGMRDNMLETEPAKATSANGYMATAGANSIIMRKPATALTSTAETSTTTNTFGDLTTVGPSLTLNTGPIAIVALAAFIQNSTGGGGGYMGFAVSGATTVAAVATRALRIMSATANENAKQSYMTFVGLTAGSNTFTAKYTTPTGGTATFATREILVMPL